MCDARSCNSRGAMASICTGRKSTRYTRCACNFRWHRYRSRRCVPDLCEATDCSMMKPRAISILRVTPSNLRSSASSTPPMSRDALAVLAGIARELHADEIARDAESVAALTAENLFYVACVGQFKRGKSTLINALIGGDLLPTGVVPVTAAITIVRYGATPRVLARFAGGSEREIDRSAIADYVAEERNPGNRKQVQAIEINAPSPILASGMCLIDTPGLGSVFETNSETTRRFLPHIDAALVVLGADPPVSGEEASIIEQIARQVPDVLFVLNKADRLPEDDLAQAV